MQDPLCHRCTLSRSLYQLLMAAAFRDGTPFPLCIEKQAHEFDRQETEH